MRAESHDDGGRSSILERADGGDRIGRRAAQVDENEIGAASVVRVGDTRHVTRELDIRADGSSRGFDLGAKEEIVDEGVDG
jgi:hypothetical protein